MVGQQYGAFTITLTATLGNITQAQNFTLYIENCSGGPHLLKEPLVDISKKEVRVYPNPAKSLVNIDLPISDIDKVYTVKVVNILGQTVLSKMMNFFDNKIEVSQLTDGFYNVILLDSNNGIFHTSKILKQKQE